MADITILIMAFVAWVPLTAIGSYIAGKSVGYHKGMSKGLHDGWVIGVGSKIGETELSDLPMFEVTA